MKLTNSGLADSIAEGMSAVLESEAHQRLFATPLEEKPVVKKAGKTSKSYKVNSDSTAIAALGHVEDWLKGHDHKVLGGKVGTMAKSVISEAKKGEDGAGEDRAFNLPELKTEHPMEVKGEADVINALQKVSRYLDDKGDKDEGGKEGHVVLARKLLDIAGEVEEADHEHDEKDDKKEDKDDKDDENDAKESVHDEERVANVLNKLVKSLKKGGHGVYANKVNDILGGFEEGSDDDHSAARDCALASDSGEGKLFTSAIDALDKLGNTVLRNRLKKLRDKIKKDNDCSDVQDVEIDESGMMTFPTQEITGTAPTKDEMRKRLVDKGVDEESAGIAVGDWMESVDYPQDFDWSQVDDVSVDGEGAMVFPAGLLGGAGGAEEETAIVATEGEGPTDKATLDEIQVEESEDGQKVLLSFHSGSGSHEQEFERDDALALAEALAGITGAEVEFGEAFGPGGGDEVVEESMTLEVPDMAMGPGDMGASDDFKQYYDEGELGAAEKRQMRRGLHDADDFETLYEEPKFESAMKKQLGRGLHDHDSADDFKQYYDEGELGAAEKRQMRRGLHSADDSVRDWEDDIDFLPSGSNKKQDYLFGEQGADEDGGDFGPADDSLLLGAQGLDEDGGDYSMADDDFAELMAGSGYDFKDLGDPMESYEMGDEGSFANDGLYGRAARKRRATLERYGKKKSKKKDDPKAKVRNRGDVVFPAASKKVKDDEDHFPINSAAQARNALSRASQYKKSPSWYSGSLSELVKAVARAVKSKYKDIDVTKAGETPGKQSARRQALLRRYAQQGQPDNNVSNILPDPYTGQSKVR